MTIFPLCRLRLRSISKWPPTEFRPHFSEVGPRQILSLTSNEVNKTMKRWSPFHVHGSYIFYPTMLGYTVAQMNLTQTAEDKKDLLVRLCVWHRRYIRVFVRGLHAELRRYNEKA